MASAPTDQTAEDYANSALSFIESELPGIDAMSVTLNQRTKPDGTLYDVMDVGWRMLPSLVDTFAEATPDAEAVREAIAVTTVTYYSHPDAAKDWQRIVLHEIVVKASKVLSIYAGLGVVHKLPDPNVPNAILRAAPTAIQPGEIVTLTWQTTDAIEVTIEPGLGVVPITGVTEVTPTVTTTYRLTAKGWLDTVVDTALVTVSGA